MTMFDSSIQLTSGNVAVGMQYFLHLFILLLTFCHILQGDFILICI